MFEYPTTGVIELVTFNNDLGLESQRFYFLSQILLSKLSPDEVEAKLRDKKEKFLREKKALNIADLMREVTDYMISQFVISRIGIPESQSKDAFTIAIIPNFGDTINPATSELDFLCEKPDSIVAAELHHVKKSRYVPILLYF